MNPDEMKRHELWRSQYRQNRYMKNLSDDELTQRFRRIAGASVRVDGSAS